ncbi:PIN domain-containing protein [Candidatus Microgenomates bacterium]|nr:PIN domain-containing protein [Candidatus Microgenomates bacterium]
MKKVLIDTSVLIEFLRVKKKKTLYERILTGKWRPVVSFITPAELWAGKSVWQDKNKTELLENLLSGIEIIFPSPVTLKLTGKLRAQYQISLLDAFIAAAAIEQKLSLATFNLKDFKKIKEVKVLENLF